MTDIFEGAVPSFRIPNLKTGWTPQGLTALDGRLLQAEYKDGRNTRLVSIDPKTGKVYGTVRIAATHAGGIAVVGDWLYVQDAPDPGHVGHEVIRCYRVSDVRAGIKSSHIIGTKPYVKRQHNQTLDQYQYASWMTTDGTVLIAGHHGIGEGSRAYAYSVDQATGLLTSHAYFLVPDFTDGAVVIPGGYLFISHGQDGYGTLSTCGRTGTVYHQQRMPNLGEGAALIGKSIFFSFESGARGGRPSAHDKLKTYYRMDLP